MSDSKGINFKISIIENTTTCSNLKERIQKFLHTCSYICSIHRFKGIVWCDRYNTGIVFTRDNQSPQQLLHLINRFDQNNNPVDNLLQLPKLMSGKYSGFNELQSYNNCGGIIYYYGNRFPISHSPIVREKAINHKILNTDIKSVPEICGVELVKLDFDDVNEDDTNSQSNTANDESEKLSNDTSGIGTRNSSGTSNSSSKSSSAVQLEPKSKRNKHSNHDTDSVIEVIKNQIKDIEKNNVKLKLQIDLLQKKEKQQKLERKFKQLQNTINDNKNS